MSSQTFASKSQEAYTSKLLVVVLQKQNQRLSEKMVIQGIYAKYILARKSMDGL